MAASWTRTRILGPESIPPSDGRFRVLGAFNPAAIFFGRQVALLVRVAEQPVEERPGQVPLPRWRPGEGQTIDWFCNEDVKSIDARVMVLRATGEARLTSASHLRLAFLDERHRVARLGPAIVPELQHEEFGIEDPRITALDGRFYITYVCVSRHGAATALMSTTDFESFERHGIIFPAENKDVVLFPERITGKYFALHRPVCSIPFTGPEIWLASSHDLIHWGRHRPLYRGLAAWETGRVGAGAPPVRTERGWLEIYHGNRRPTAPGEVGAYCAGGMLLADDDPSHILQFAQRPLLEPTEPYETAGFVPNVVFPEAVTERGDRIAVYYGAADEATAVAETSWDDLWRNFD
jgi:beta-1,2-mannobiose phosphorylase / 1,2-beta-oligomannan phosphorylase